MHKIGYYFINSNCVGGTRQYNLSMLEALAALPAEKYELIVFTNKESIADLKDYKLRYMFSENSSPSFLGKVLFKALRELGLPMSWYRAVSPYFHPVVKMLLSQKCNLWVFPYYDPLSYQAPLPAMIAVHDLMHRYERHFPEVATEFNSRDLIYTNICQWGEAFLVDSELGKQQVQESYGVNPDKIYVLPYIPSKWIFSQLEKPDGNAFDNLPDKFIFYPAQFWEHKNHKGLINAAALLKNKIPELKIIFVGSEKNAYEPVRALVKKLGLEENFFFLGYIPDEDIPELYRRARALIMPTFFGPTNIPPLEAMALGCPVGVSDIYAMREQLGDAALYFNPASVTEIAQVLEQLWLDDDLCRELARRGLAKSSQKTQVQFNQQLRNIIDEILKP